MSGQAASPAGKNGAPKKLRILVLNGSPRADGNSVRLAGMFTCLAGGEADTIHLYDEGPEPCRACLACVRGAPCPLPDSESRVERILRRMAEADCLALASPIHFTSLTAPVVAFISRLQPMWHMGIGLTPKRVRSGALLLSGGSVYDNMFRPARSVAAAAFKVLGVEFVGMVGAVGTDTTPVGDDPSVLAEIKQLTERVRACSNGS